MVSSTGPIASVQVAPVVRSVGADEAKVRAATTIKPVEPKTFSETPARQAVSRPPASLTIIPSETGQRLIYVFRDPESGEKIKQYPTQSAIALAIEAGHLVDREV